MLQYAVREKGDDIPPEVVENWLNGSYQNGWTLFQVVHVPHRKKMIYYFCRELDRL